VKLCDIEKKEVFYDKLTYYYIEMPKFNKKEEELKSHLEYWLWFMKNLNKIEEEPEKLKKDKVIKEAFDVASFLALSKDEQFAYMLEQKAILDYKNTIDYAKETGMEEGLEKGLQEGLQKGLEQGKKEGEKEAKIKIAKNLLDILDNNTIAKKTGLSVEEIEKLRR
jgi:predicted transposase/invertase (TIGR01784 family)